MDAAVRIAFKEFRDRGVLAERFEQLDLGVRQRDEHRVHAMIRLRHHGRHVGAERVAIELARLRDVADRDRDVIESADHHASTRRNYTINTWTRHIGFFCQWPATAARTARLT